MASHQKQEQSNQEAVAEARNRNRETVKNETGGIWESLFKYTLPVVMEGFNRMNVGTGKVSSGGEADDSSTTNNHQPSDLLRQTPGRQEETNPANTSLRRNIGNTGLLGQGASSPFGRDQRMVGRPLDGLPGILQHQRPGFSMTHGNSFGGHPRTGRSGGFGGGGRSAYHHHH